jgi:hypothetical protein
MYDAFRPSESDDGLVIDWFPTESRPMESIRSDEGPEESITFVYGKLGVVPTDFHLLF